MTDAPRAPLNTYYTEEQDIPTVERRLVVTEKAGLHARPAALFAQTAARYEGEVTVARSPEPADRPGAGREVSARSVLSLMTLNIRCGDEIVIRARGADGAEVVDALAAIAAPPPA
ncbi:HPr family phosphocarrier protein [Streptomyces sp. QL37]|uniref:HPr family phosphocarrier protein n=1 Tax=Streptomyces sp. QL37 TaxID=2093747 RepID=UPI000CF24D07|nr:HPr family phosphocarrier protein [Streptomyces sp. QL37]PPQ56092.1 HPr family phosphocarrier protein [Streptomyces sp. QL37]